MERFQRAAILISLVRSLRAHGSWCGETHMQKSSYLLKELLSMPLDYIFVLYKYGPYSFDLSGDLTAMRADALLRQEVRPYPYGPAFIPGEASDQILPLFPRTLKRYADPIEFVASRLGAMGVADLERVSTALYVTREQGAPTDVERRAERIVALKPHVSLVDARDAVHTIDAYIRDARGVRTAQIPA
jgi:hypothetical protein